MSVTGGVAAVFKGEGAVAAWGRGQGSGGGGESGSDLESGSVTAARAREAVAARAGLARLGPWPSRARFFLTISLRLKKSRKINKKNLKMPKKNSLSK